MSKTLDQFYEVMVNTSSQTWKQRAEKVISDCIAEASAQGFDHKALLALVEGRYPFGERRRYPYQAWLAVRKQMLGVDKVRPNKGKPVAVDQQSLF